MNANMKANSYGALAWYGFVGTFLCVVVSSQTVSSTSAEQTFRKVLSRRSFTSLNSLPTRNNLAEIIDTHQTSGSVHGRTKRSAFSPHDTSEKEVLSFTPLISRHNKIEVFPKVSFIGAESLRLSWLVTPMDQKTSFDTVDETLGLKVKYRSFGSTVERELIFIIDSKSLVGKKTLENHYITGNLLPGTGYVLCFSLVDEHDILGALASDEYSTISTKDSPADFSMEDHDTDLSSEILQDDIKAQINPYGDNGNHQPIQTTHSEASTTAAPAAQTTSEENSRTTTVPAMSSRSTEESTSFSTTTESVQVFTNFARGLPPTPDPNRGSYAYTSTGELVYLPGSSWTPPRKRRSLRVKDVGVISNDNEVCIEVFTQQSKAFVSWNPFIVLIVMLIVFGVVISLGIIYCMKSCMCKGFVLRKWVKNKIRPTIKKTTPCKTEDPENTEESVDKHEDIIDEIEVLREKLNCHCRNSSLPSYQEILTRHELKEKLKGTLKSRKNKSLDTLDFHPGYEVPPMSTNEVYGYDIPKFSSRGPRTLTTPSTAYSSDLNENDHGFSWSSRNGYNLDHPSEHRKESEGYKRINPNVRSTDHTDSDIRSAPPMLMPRARHRSITELNFESMTPEVNEEPPLYKHTSRIPPASHPAPTSYIQSLPPELPRRSSSNSEVTVSGGTLIEVPDGYVIPESSKSIRLILNTDPVYI